MRFTICANGTPTKLAMSYFSKKRPTAANAWICEEGAEMLSELADIHAPVHIPAPASARLVARDPRLMSAAIAGGAAPRGLLPVRWRPGR